jgi:ABC-2 type transport system ATP-binding protein
MTRTTVVVDTTEPTEALAALPGVHGLHREDGLVRFEVDGDRVEPMMRTLAALGVRSIQAHPPTLEQLLMRHYGDDLAARGGREVG